MPPPVRPPEFAPPPSINQGRPSKRNRKRARADRASGGGEPGGGPDPGDPDGDPGDPGGSEHGGGESGELTEEERRFKAQLLLRNPKLVPQPHFALDQAIDTTPS